MSSSESTQTSLATTTVSDTMTPTHHVPTTETSHPDNPVPEEPKNIDTVMIPTAVLGDTPISAASSRYTAPSDISSEDESPSTPNTDVLADDGLVEKLEIATLDDDVPAPAGGRRRGSTMLVSQNSDDVRRLLSDVGEAGTQMLQTPCCGGGCCKMQPFPKEAAVVANPITPPQNDAFKSLSLKLGVLEMDSELTNLVSMPEKTVSLLPVPESHKSIDTRKGVFESDATTPTNEGPLPIHPGTKVHPPTFVKPHPPYDVYSAPIWHARELTRPGAEKRTYHFDLDVTDYPAEGGDVDFVVGGAIGVCPPNDDEVVDDLFDILGVPKFIRDRKVLLKTTTGRWPTIWGDDQARELVTTRRDLLTWCADLQSYPPTKNFFRLLAEYASEPSEKKILMYLSSGQGQGAFCDLRTGPHVTIAQILHAFTSSRPPLDHLLSSLNQLMPRFYSLSQDPQISVKDSHHGQRRLVEIAVTVHESDDWSKGQRTGVGSGFLERTARKFIEAEKAGIDARDANFRVPVFRGLMANPLAREFVSDGPMLLIGAGVGVAPFRGFVQRRLQSANCANKVWVLQGVRDSLLDELYSGEWGVHEDQVKKVVQSRAGESRYVQEEVRHQADLVWFVANALDGRVFVCGSSKGMGEGVEQALTDVAMAKGNLNREEAKEFWKGKKEGGQYIAETW